MTTTTTENEQRTAASMRWTVDRDGTSVDFAVKTFWGLSTVHGRFDHFDGSYEVGPGRDDDRADDRRRQPRHRVTATRDKHLRSIDFFDVAEHPQVRFTSTRVADARRRELHVTGELEAAGMSVPLALDATVRQVDHGLEVEATTTVDQRQLGMSNGLLGMIRLPATLHVKGRLSGVDE